MTGLIAKKIAQINSEIPSNVSLIAVTKQVTVDKIREAYQAGVRNFAENRLQEALDKQEKLRDIGDISWHFIGHLQSNKARKILQHFHWIHSVDHLNIAVRLNSLAKELGLNPQVLLQIKLLPDPNKYGWNESDLKQDLAQLNELNHLKIKGLMTILPLGLTDSEIFATFEKTRDIASEINQENWSNLKLTELSMGMSSDYLLALKAGATMIRLGTIIFGDRN
jgi:pyridoxal phosphate enzyme (YggS family)